MRRLLPTTDAVDLDDAYAGFEPPTHWVALGMVGSLDGAVTVGGTSGALGGGGDLAAFRALRALGDVVLVGLGTAIAEDYRPTWQPRQLSARAARGQEPLPRLALVTGSGEVPEDHRVLGDPDRPPLVITTTARADIARSRVRGRAEVVAVPTAADGRVDLQAAVAALADRGLMRVVCEGGPTLNNAMLAAGVVDELFVTVAPTLVGGGTGIVGPELPGGPHALTLLELRVHGSELVCRYRWDGPAGR